VYGRNAWKQQVSSNALQFKSRYNRSVEKLVAMTTCDDINFNSCGENEKGDWSIGDWQPDLSQFNARRQCIAYIKHVKPWRTSKSQYLLTATSSALN
jgi:hypothetical protein